MLNRLRNVKSYAHLYRLRQCQKSSPPMLDRVRGVAFRPANGILWDITNVPLLDLKAHLPKFAPRLMPHRPIVAPSSHFILGETRARSGGRCRTLLRGFGRLGVSSGTDALFCSAPHALAIGSWDEVITSPLRFSERP